MRLHTQLAALWASARRRKRAKEGPKARLLSSPPTARARAHAPPAALSSAGSSVVGGLLISGSWKAPRSAAPPYKASTGITRCA